MNKYNNKMTNRKNKEKNLMRRIKVARRLFVGKKVRVSPGFITHTEYVISCANDYS